MRAISEKMRRIFLDDHPRLAQKQSVIYRTQIIITYIQHEMKPVIGLHVTNLYSISTKVLRAPQPYSWFLVDRNFFFLLHTDTTATMFTFTITYDCDSSIGLHISTRSSLICPLFISSCVYGCYHSFVCLHTISIFGVSTCANVLMLTVQIAFNSPISPFFF